MPRRYFRKLAALCKVETVYGTSAAPTGADALLLTDVTLTPLEGEKVDRGLILPYFGDQGFALAANYARVEFSVEMAGAGGAGLAPKYASLLRACGLAELITAATKVEYKPVTALPEAATVFVNMDGVNHTLLGARGTVSLSVVPRQIPKFRFSLMGLFGPVTDTVLPSVSLAGWEKPLVVSKAATTFGLHGVSAVLESLELALGNQVENRMLVGSESIEIVDRRASGTAVIEAVPIATKDWFTAARSSAAGPLSLVHGTAAGNIVEIAAPGVQVGQPSYGQTQGIANTSLPLTLSPVQGDDELTIRVR